MIRLFNQSASFTQQKDPGHGAESDYSVEFKSGFGITDPYASNNIIDTSGPLWGPDIRVQQTPALTSQKLELWRNYSEQPKSVNAAAELDKLYASLPDDKLDLTLKDLVEARKASPKGSPRVTPAKDGDSMTIGAILGRKHRKEVQRGAAREDGGKFKPKNKVHNSTSISLPFRLPTLSPKRDKSSAAIPNGSPERQSLSSHFRADSEVDGSAPRDINAGSSASFSEYETASFSVAIEAEKSHSPNRETSSDSTDPLTLRQQLSQSACSEVSKSPNVRHAVAQAQNCCICSSSNLIFKTRCTVCGKTYCSKCVKKGMGGMLDGRKCKKTCAGRPSNSRFTKKAGVGCWPLFGFSNNHANVAETTAKMSGERQEGSRLQEFEMQRKSSSYPPRRPSTLQASPRRSPPRTSPRQSTQRAPSRPITQQYSPHSFPTGSMTVF